MIIRALEIANFRKFRDPIRIDGLRDGLNIVVEPNETGKSTLLDALRAAFFIRHSAKTEHVRTFVPFGDEVAPRVAVDFEAKGNAWTLEKQFMKSTFVRLTGGGNRREADAAEEALQDLLGFERGNNRGNDVEVRGPLGMLWVGQNTAMTVESPNRIVRNSVRGVLEAEVGEVTGGRRFDSIRAAIEAEYQELRTQRSGQARGELAAAQQRHAAAVSARQQAEATLREFERSLTDLESAQARLRIVERDLADPATIAERTRLEGDLKLAETAALRLATAEAQHGRAEELARAAATKMERLEEAGRRSALALEELGIRRIARDEAQAALTEAVEVEKARRSQLEVARSRREERDAAVAAARRRQRASEIRAGAVRAVAARDALAELEARERLLREEVAKAIGKDELAAIARLELASVQARARFEAGIVKVEVELADRVSLEVDGHFTDATGFDVLAVTRFQIGDAGSIVVRPPQGAGRSLEADVAAAEEALSAALRRAGIGSHASGIVINERAAAANDELGGLRRRIAAASPGDPAIGLAAGADALHAFVANLPTDDDAVEADQTEDVEALERQLEAARLTEAAAVGAHEECRRALSKAETSAATVAAELASAEKECEASAARLSDLLGDDSREALIDNVGVAQRERAVRFEALEQARAGAQAFNAEAVGRRIGNIERAARRAAEERLELVGRIASLDATILREGSAGPAGRLVACSEEEEAATAACERLTQEADTLDLLRSALAEAGREASRTFLAPVTRRAARYIEQLLPGCGLSFDDELGLTSVSRAGFDEGCGVLSQGTQEQLAILTRLAFADILLEDGAPISLILDDPLVYSDDARLEIMTDILQEAAGRMQVILLTCRSKAFRHVDGHRLVL